MPCNEKPAVSQFASSVLDEWILSVSSFLLCTSLAKLQTHGSSPEPGTPFFCQVPFSSQSFNYHFRRIITQGGRDREQKAEMERAGV